MSGTEPHAEGGRPFMFNVSQLRGPIHLGMDVAKDAIAVGILGWGEETPVVDRIFHDEVSVRRLVARFDDPTVLRACYEAGPTGYELYRLLVSLGVRCDVVAPALIPRRAGDRVKTDRRDAQRLARLHRAGELTAIRVRRRPRKRYGICAGPARIWSPTGVGFVSGSRRFCCAMAASIGAVGRGRSSISGGWPRRVSTTRRCG